MVPFSDIFPKCLIVGFINLWFLQEVSESRTLGFRLDGLPLAIKSNAQLVSVKVCFGAFAIFRIAR